MRPPTLLRVDVNQKDRCACALRKWITWWRAPGYSTVAGIFKQYELVCIVGDERDLLRVRTTYRRPREDADVYRIRAPRENIRRPFLDNLETMNDMATRPRFYDTLTTNCTTGAFMHTRVNPDAPAWSRRIRFSGYVPDYLYEVGRLDTARPSPSSSASRS